MEYWWSQQARESGRKQGKEGAAQLVRDTRFLGGTKASEHIVYFLVQVNRPQG